MEDAHAMILSLDEGEEQPNNSFFAVYDGHGGDTAAKFAGDNVHKKLVSEEAYREKRYEDALKRAFLDTDRALFDKDRKPSEKTEILDKVEVEVEDSFLFSCPGSTMVAALVTGDGKIYVANAGDSRSVISVKGKVKPLSIDHKPLKESEKARILGAGGYISNGRVNGKLALTRGLGDFEFKNNKSLSVEKQIITADPDVTVHDITKEEEFFVIACDGIWDCLSSQQVVDFVRLKVSEGEELAEICEMMCDHCLAPDANGNNVGCDNMTVVIVAILGGRTKEEWYSWIAGRVKQNYGYHTPTTIPQIYSQNRLRGFKEHQKRFEASQLV